MMPLASSLVTTSLSSSFRLKGAKRAGILNGLAPSTSSIACSNASTCRRGASLSKKSCGKFLRSSARICDAMLVASSLSFRVSPVSMALISMSPHACSSSWRLSLSFASRATSSISSASLASTNVTVLV